MSSTRAAGSTIPSRKVTRQGRRRPRPSSRSPTASRFKSITAWRKDNSTTPIDFDALPAIDVDVPGIYKNKQFSQEVQLEVERGRSPACVGAYYLDADAQTIFDVRLFNPDTPDPGFTAFTDSDVDTKTWAMFGDFTYDITDQLQRLARRPLHQRQAPCDGLPPILSSAADRTDLRRPRHPVRRAQRPISTASASDTDFTPRASVSFKPNDDHHFYASYSQGFKGGGFDPRGQSTQAPDLDRRSASMPTRSTNIMTFEPETVDKLRAGLEGRAASTSASDAGRRRCSTPTIRTCRSRLRSAASTAGGVPTFCGLTSNAGKARIPGRRVRRQCASRRKSGSGDRLNFAWSLGYLNAEYQGIPDAREPR